MTTASPQASLTPGAVQTVDVKTAAAWLARREAVLVDVREPAEFAALHIDGAALLPLSKFDPATLPATSGQTKLIFQCKSGTRARQAAARSAAVRSELWVLDGGIEAWKQAGLPVIQAAAGGLHLDVQRQTQFTIGALVLLGTLLGAFLSPWFLVVPGFIACGLMFAGLSGACMLALLIARMPWNQKQGATKTCCHGACGSH
jgi:rhodanese-related sulfurtransferase